MLFHRRIAIARGVRDVARQLGYDGDLFAEFVPKLGTPYQEHDIGTIRLWAQPRPRNDEEREYLKRLARAAVLAVPYDVAGLLTHDDDYQSGEYEHSTACTTAEPSAAIRRATRIARKGR